MADDRFLLAEFQLNYVLGKAVPVEMKDALTSLPLSLQDAYDKTFEPMTEGQKQVTFQVMSWIYHAVRPLRMRELQEALVIQERKREYDEDSIQEHREIVAECASLVEYDTSTDIVRFAHYTVQEYLRDRCMPKLLPSITLGKRCLTYLNTTLFDETLPESDDELNSWLETHQFSRYAVCWWASHKYRCCR
jgi:hypothetical protein